MRRLLRHRRFLHAALLAVVALGMLVQPMLAGLADLHDVEHAVIAEAGHGHEHHDGHGGPDGHDDEAPCEPVGAHVLLHQGGFAASAALGEPWFLMLPPLRATGPPSPAATSGRAMSRLTLPFRPPIA